MTTTFLEQPALLLVVGEEDKPYVSKLNGPLGGCRTKVYSGEVVTTYELNQLAKRNGLNCVATTRQDVLRKLLPAGRDKKANISNYAGSIIPCGDIEYLILEPLKQLVTVSYGEFLARRYLSKHTKRAAWGQNSQFDWKLIEDEVQFRQAKQWLEQCHMIAVDTETWAPNLIRCVGYCGFIIHPDGRRESMAYVIPLAQLGTVDAVRWMRQLNWLQVPKVLQNGKYDCAYFAAWNAPLWGYFYDTVNAFHSWLSELPKDLASVTCFFVRASMYWKDLADSGDSHDYYRYNALDCWGTGESFLSWLDEAPVWAKRNYVTEFSLVPACHMCEMTGIKRDMVELESVNKEYSGRMAEVLRSLKAMVAPEFNPSSHVQVLKLLKALGYRQAESSKESVIQEASYVHPLNEHILGGILEYRGLRKLLSTYLSTGDDAKEFLGRILFSLNPHGTDTARKSSREHHFWCGLQIQNIPRDGQESGAVKGTLRADDGFDLWEADLKSAEAYGVAFKSGDENLLRAINSPKDFHSLNAAAFFGVPYEQIYQDAQEQYIDGITGVFYDAVEACVLDRQLRDLSKRTNHGANYNMGKRVMLDTMGSKRVRAAQRLLKLPGHMSLLDICAFLLHVYERTYPVVKTKYYDKIKSDIKKTGLLVGDTGWTRRCFGNPAINKQSLNAYIAHVTQSLNAVLLDRSFIAVFLELAFNPNFKLIAQIHDSVLFQVRKGHEALAQRVKELMTLSVPIEDCQGTIRTMRIPVDLKCHGQYWRSNQLK